MNFKHWLSEEIAIKEQLFQVVKEFAEENELPLPVSKIGEGMEAIVYQTTNPKLVVRITRDHTQSVCEKKMYKSEIQNTGGVVKIIENKDYKDHNISYKEKVNIDVVGFLKKLHPNNYKDIMANIDNIGANWNIFDSEKSLSRLSIKESMEYLSHFEITKNFVKAIQKGVSGADLHQQNLGINSSNHLVVIDC